MDSYGLNIRCVKVINVRICNLASIKLKISLLIMMSVFVLMSILPIKAEPPSDGTTSARPHGIEQVDTSQDKQDEAVNQEEIERLIKHLEDDSTSSAAIERLVEIGKPAVPALIPELFGGGIASNDPQAMRLIIKARDFSIRVEEVLVKIGTIAVPILINALCSEKVSGSSKLSIAIVLGDIGDKRAIPVLIKKMGERWYMGRCVEALGKIGISAVPALVKALGDENKYVRAGAVEALGNIGDSRAVPYLMKALDDKDPDVRKSAEQALTKTGKDVADFPAKLPSSKDKIIREHSSLNMWVMVTEEERESFNAAMQQLKEDFKFREEFQKKMHIEVPIDIELIPWATAKDRLAEALIDPDKAPDISQVGSTWVEWVKANTKLVPLEVEQPDQFVPAALSSCPRTPGENRFYAVPWFVDVRAMYYNKKLYRDAPTKATEKNWNWDVLEEACKKILEESTGKESFFPIAFAGTREWTLLHDTVPWIWGANSVDDALSFIIHLANAYGNTEDLRLNREIVEGKFLRGNYAMIVSGYWLIGRADDYKSLAGNITPDDIGILPIPAQADNEPYTFVGGSHLVLFDKPKRSKEATQVAKAFIQFLLELEQQISYSEKARVLPAQEVALASVSCQVPHAEYFQQLLTLGRSYPARQDWAEVEFRLVKNLTLAWDFASGLYTCAQDPKTNGKAKNTLSEIINLAKPYWAYITK